MNNKGTQITKEEFCRLYGEQKDKLYRYALYRLRSPEDAEDAVSEAVMAAWKSIGKLKSTDSFGAWIMSILAATCSTHIKAIIKNREKLEKAQEAGEASGASYAPASLSAELAEAMSLLSDEERSIVLLSVIGGLSSKEIAETTDLTAGAVRSKLSRSLAKMREFLS